MNRNYGIEYDISVLVTTGTDGFSIHAPSQGHAQVAWVNMSSVIKTKGLLPSILGVDADNLQVVKVFCQGIGECNDLIMGIQPISLADAVHDLEVLIRERPYLFAYLGMCAELGETPSADGLDDILYSDGSFASAEDFARWYIEKEEGMSTHSLLEEHIAWDDVADEIISQGLACCYTDSSGNEWYFRVL